jgi:hypothetical protein
MGMLNLPLARLQAILGLHRELLSLLTSWMWAERLI